MPLMLKVVSASRKMRGLRPETGCHSCRRVRIVRREQKRRPVRDVLTGLRVRGWVRFRYFGSAITAAAPVMAWGDPGAGVAPEALMVKTKSLLSV